MAQITKADEMVGRTIEGALVEPWIVVLNLGGGDFVHIEPEHDYDDGVRLEFDQFLSFYDRHVVGLLSKEEYEKAEEEHERIRCENRRAQELTLLKELRQKYPEEADDGNESRA